MVTHTAERSGERPVAKALGMWLSAIATRGLGMSAIAQSRSIMPCSSGACSGVTTRAPIARSATVSERHHWKKATPMPASPIRMARPPPTAYIRPTTRATNSPPRMNITAVIRTVSPESLTKRVRAMSGERAGGHGAFPVSPG